MHAIPTVANFSPHSTPKQDCDFRKICRWTSDSRNFHNSRL